jgi:N-acetyl sugar amidotransferase
MTPIAVQTCKRCLYRSDHPLGLVIDAQGICSGCRVHEEKDQIDWSERWDKLEQIIKPYRSRDSRNYDCIVPVSGAGDSFFIVHLVKERLGLKPLLVTYNRYYNTPLGIRNLAQLRRRFDCDILIQSVNPLAVKKIIRTTLRLLGSFHWPVLAGQSVFPVRTAVSHGVPLILWGAHQGLEQVGMFSHWHEVEMTRRYRKDHDLLGYEADDLLSHFDCLTEADIWQYRYPDESRLEQVGVRGLYLGNYVRWDPVAQHIQMVKHAGYHSATLQRTFDVYDHVDDWHYMGLHDSLKQVKCGFGKVLDHACREIRHRRLSRKQGEMLVDFYQQTPPEFESLFLDWLGLSPSGLGFLVAHHARHSRLGRQDQQTELRGVDLESMGFRPNDNLARDQGFVHVILGKGYPD